MEPLKLKLQSFEGPLDLLLHLIDKAEVDITEVSISEITDQYMVYVDLMQVLNLEIASEFLVMASSLLAMKSRLLLPRPIELDVPLIDYEDPDYDPRQALMERLIEYKKYKQLAEDLREREEKRSRVFTKPPENLTAFLEDRDKQPQPNPVEGVTLFDLLDAFRKALSKAQPDEYVADVHRDEISVEGRTFEIMDRLLFSGGSLSFSALLGDYYRRGDIVVTFLAVLELMKKQKVRCLQDRLFEDIIIEAVLDIEIDNEIE
ncbi:segregation/condensation protein A [Tumebacillus sp. DT12]|uniref:Segregation and condensation protein A n=1 Tax=Tumebacillus lacus TaxID=2995335 RepID=A0ABT3X0E6_9BACL|nr:segregation/condensation protein A [Tumebacillus lacus]MCX7569076.1 segregation/condensation protein A [Tumebacillus lacus]